MVDGDAEMNLAAQLNEKANKGHGCIVVIGDVMYDHWVHGHINDCQEGCLKIIEKNSCVVPGGADNARNCLSNWDVRTELFGQQGKDCAEKWRFVDVDNKILFRWDREPKVDLSKYSYVYSRALERVGCAAGVLLSDYDKGFLSLEFIKDVVSICARRGIPCVVDAKREPKMYSGAILKCNSIYYAKYAECIDFSRLVVTNGDRNPMIWNCQAVSGLGIDLSSVPCVNHVGAGDCFAAHLTLALAYGFSLRESAAIAHSAGRVYVQRNHNTPPHPNAIVKDMDSYVVSRQLSS